MTGIAIPVYLSVLDVLAGRTWCDQECVDRGQLLGAHFLPGLRQGPLVAVLPSQLVSP